MERRFLGRAIDAMADRGLLTVAVWASLNIAVAAFVTYVVHASIGGQGIFAIVVINAVLVLWSGPYWPKWMQKREPPEDP